MTAKSSIASPTALVNAEERIRDAEHDVARGFFSIGESLKTIRDLELWKQSGVANWNEYCKSGRVDFSKRHANSLIRAFENRKLLAELPEVGNRFPSWTISTVNELNRMRLPTDIKRVSRKVAVKVGKGERFTTKLVRRLVDYDLGVTERRKESRKRFNEPIDVERIERDIEDERIDDTPTLAQQFDEWIRDSDARLHTLNNLSAELWQEAESDDPDIAAKMRSAFERLAKFKIAGSQG